MKVKTAPKPLAWLMKQFGFRGWTSFWNTIYVIPGYEHATWLINHEKKHLEQIERDGILKFSVKYTYWLLKYGYKDNPYEIEARAAEHN